MDNSVNVNFSVNNLPQIDRHQAEVHRAPVVNQEQNAQLAHEEAVTRLAKPVETDAPEHKAVDPDDRKRRDRRRKKRPHSAGGTDDNPEPRAVIGPFGVDVQA